VAELWLIRPRLLAWRRRWIEQGEILRCLPNGVLTLAAGFDWMEWQASYAGGALLMPRTWLHLTVLRYFRGRREIYQVPNDSPQARDLYQLVSEAFFVSDGAARGRLSQLGYFANWLGVGSEIPLLAVCRHAIVIAGIGAVSCSFRDDAKPSAVPCGSSLRISKGGFGHEADRRPRRAFRSSRPQEYCVKCLD
jgi:hypothetical protein